MTHQWDTRLDGYAPSVLSLFRIFVGLIYLCHGTSTLFGFPAATAQPMGSLHWYAGVIELIAGLLITVGLFTRPAAFVAAGEMAVAFFTQHLPHGFWPIGNGGELAVVLCWAFLLLVCTGPGVWAVDQMRHHRGHDTRHPVHT